MGMTDLEKVIKALKCCITDGPDCPNDCPYLGDCNRKQLHIDAITLLEALEPKPPIWKERIVPVFEEYEDGTGGIKSHNWSDWFCPTCGGLVGERYWIPGREPHDQHRCNYCPKCGQAIDWESTEK